MDFVFAQFREDSAEAGRSRMVLQNAMAPMMAGPSRVDGQWLADNTIDDRCSGLHYLLVSWIDDAFIASRRWESEWQEHRFENRFDVYEEKGLGNLRSVRVRQLADEFLHRGYAEPLEVVWLMFQLGFRGDYQPAEQRRWCDAARELLTHHWQRQLPAIVAPELPDAPPAPAPLELPGTPERAVRMIWGAGVAVWLFAALALFVQFVNLR